MGYVLWQGEPITMKKGTISMWFRVPKESIEGITWSPDYVLNPLQNMIPLLAFSKQPYGPWTEFTFPVINTFYRNTTPPPGLPKNYQPFPYYGSVPGPTWQLPYWPCVIALYIDQNKTAKLAAVLQTLDVGEPVNTSPSLVSATGEVGGSGEEEGLLFGPKELGWANGSSADAKMEWFEPNLDGPEVAFDVWHHVLLSWDLKKSNRAEGNIDLKSHKQPNEYVSDTSTMYCALDDINLTQDDLPAAQWTEGFGDNEIVCYSCWKLAGNPYDTETDSYLGLPTYTVDFHRGIQMDAVAVPSEPMYERWLGDATSDATEEVKDANKKIEVAELQIFSDFVLNTSSERNRRAFIDFLITDEADPPKGKNLMEPVDPDVTEMILGRRPDILLHKTRNWQNGNNTGAIGLKRDPVEGDEIIASGQFVPNGTIKKWTPDPRLLAEGGSSTTA